MFDLQDAQSTKSIVSIDGFEYIVVEMVVQYLMKTEYNLDKRQKLENYTLEHLKKAAKDSDDGTITVKVEGGLTELHVKVYLCATYLKASVLQKVAFRNI
ncbi:hypothetical protein J4E90_003141 [Alternaria incomplexa]|uniref:uncharacterized protein n=1 Tax=Alternaria incomplexa TaxID=1187928 RepID=UPI00221ED2C3|nr:uncharacterized protein J4E90_003141 [Alternaria incomplexa]KAI4918753.1 hypothetical protein J4E90_003141 [Alternaria incomplexa]